MKKTLVALAALAATGAFAQVTITGNLTMGYLATTGGTGVQASGFGVDPQFGDIVDFKASEDLGGGMKAAASFGLASADRGNGATGGDTSLALSGNFGTFTVANTRLADYLSRGVAAVGGSGFDGLVFSPEAVATWVQYTFPVTSALKVGFTQYGAPCLSSTTPNAWAGAATSCAGTALGTGQAGVENSVASTFDNQRLNLLTATYTSGPLVLDAGYGSYDQDSSSSTANTGAHGLVYQTRIRGSVSYDLGVVKLGAGLDNRQYNVGTRSDALLSFNVPVGSAFVGMDWVSRTVNGTDSVTTVAPFVTNGGLGLDGTISGYALNAGYNFSKTTTANLQYWSYTHAIGDAQTSNAMEVSLTKKF